MVAEVLTYVVSMPARTAFERLPLGAVRPQGWLARHLRLHADGLSGQLDQVWPDLTDSAWIGGPGEAWERGPYWLDGFIPLAFLLGDEALVARARAWVDGILERQADDGWFGPDQPQNPADAWPQFVVLKALAQWVEATGDERVVPAMLRCFSSLERRLPERPLFDWAAFRWAELGLSAVWLHHRTGEQLPVRVALLALGQAFDWSLLAESFPYHGKQPLDAVHPDAPPYPCMTFRTDLASHVVNCAMALKHDTVRWQLTGDPSARERATRLLAELDRYHGLVTGVFTGDEHLAGLSPSQGTELCAVVEALFSLQVMVAALGDAALADRLDRIGWNALPGAFTDDAWRHQYVQQVNQVACVVSEDRVWTNNDADAGVWGLEPHFGCCTANYHQGWPKLTAAQWMRAPGGLAAVSYGPVTVSTDVDGAPIRVSVEGDYPFRDVVRLQVEASSKVALHLRVPGWAVQPTITVGDSVTAVAPGTFHVLEKTWSGVTEVQLSFPARPELVERPRGAGAVVRGPLVLSLPLPAAWTAVPPSHRKDLQRPELLQDDLEARPTQPWSFALVPGEIGVEELPVADNPFATDTPALTATVRAVPVAWDMQTPSAAEPPPLAPPVASEAQDEARTLRLIPYGATRLRLTELPVRSSAPGRTAG